MAVDVRVPDRPSAAGDQHAPEGLGTGDAHPAQLGQDDGRGALDRHLEREPVGDRPAFALDALKTGQPDAVGVHEPVPSGAVGQGHDGHSSHSHRRTRS
jgi:hypothetical protein